MQNLDKRIENLKIGGVEKLKKSGEINSTKKRTVKDNGGRRKGSGRKPKEETLIARGIKAYLDEHCNENVQIRVVDPKTGQSRTIPKPRVVRVMEALYDIGINDRSPEALGKWLDRALGKPLQKIAGEEGAEPIHVDVNMDYILDKAYGNKDRSD